jgi:hypothetical protein
MLYDEIDKFIIEDIGLTFEITNNESMPQPFLWGKIKYQPCLESMVLTDLVSDVRTEIVSLDTGICLYLCFTFLECNGYHLWTAYALVKTEWFVSNPFLNKWKELLKTNDGLDLRLDFLEDFKKVKCNRSFLFKMLHRSEIDGFIKKIDRAIIQMSLSNKPASLTYQQFELKISNIIVKDLMTKRSAASDSDTGINLTTLEENILLHISRNSLPDSELYRALLDKEALLKSFDAKYNSLLLEFDYSNIKDNVYARGKRALFAYLSTVGVDDWEETFKLYMFLRICLELSQGLESNEMDIPYSLNSKDNGWALTEISVESFDTLMLAAEKIRYYLSRDWHSLNAGAILPVVDSTLKVACAVLGNIPNRSAFDSIDKLLSFAVLEQRYGIDRLSTIVIGKVGCREISYFPATDGTGDILVRLVVSEGDGIKYCVFGCLNPYKKSIDWSYPSNVEVVAKILKLLSFIVALGYRDLVVARQSFAQIYAKNIPCKHNLRNKKGKSSSATKSKPARSNGLTPIILVPRFSSPVIEKSFADPDRFATAVRKVMPHHRTAHIRMLPPGHKRSQSQVELASSLSVMLPEGYTFVRSSVVGEGTPEEAAKMATFQSLSLLELLFDGDE